MKFFYLFLSIIIYAQTYAYRYGYTIKNNTIVYADKELLIPIGKIKGKKKVRVSDNTFKSNTISAIIVAGKISYIVLEDINFNRNGSKVEGPEEIKEYNIDNLFSEEGTSYKKNNYLSFAIGKIYTQSDFKEINNLLNIEHVPLTQYKIFIIHRNPLQSYSFDIGLSYIQAKTADSSFRTLTLDFAIQKNIFKKKSFSFELFGEFSFSGDARVEVKNQEISKGTLFGYNLGGKFLYHLNSKYLCSLNISVQNLGLFSMEEITIQNKKITPEKIAGLKFLFTLSKEII